jgi:hypothetical protein
MHIYYIIPLNGREFKQNLALIGLSTDVAEEIDGMNI